MFDDKNLIAEAFLLIEVNSNVTHFDHSPIGVIAISLCFCSGFLADLFDITTLFPMKNRALSKQIRTKVEQNPN
jgi:hypothetical protein